MTLALPVLIVGLSIAPAPAELPISAMAELFAQQQPLPQDRPQNQAQDPDQKEKKPDDPQNKPPDKAEEKKPPTPAQMPISTSTAAS